MVVEGKTEVEFVKRVLAPALSQGGVAATPVSMDGNVTRDRRVGKRYDASKVIVYVQRHEFEGLRRQRDGSEQADSRVDSGLSETPARPVGG